LDLVCQDLLWLMMTVAAEDEILLLVHVTQLESRVAFWVGFDEKPAGAFEFERCVF